MKTFLFFAIALFGCITANAQVTIGSTAVPQAGSVLDLQSGGNKALLLPRVADTSSITTPSFGMFIYATVSKKTYYHNGARWVETSNANTAWSLIGNTGTTAGTNFIGTTDAKDLVIKTNSTEWMRVLSNGNVGIGTTTPNFKLHVGGGGNGSGNQTGIQVGDVGTGPGPLFLVHNQPQIQGNSYYNSGFFYAGGTGKPSVIQLSDGIRFVTSNNAPGAANTPVTDFAESMTISTNGNVGIGAPAPAYRLDLGGGTFGFGVNNVRTESRLNAGLAVNAGAQSGFFENDGVSVTNYPAGASGYWHLIDARHSNPANNYALQIAGSFFDQRLWFRKTNNNPAQAWSEILTTANLNTSAWSLTGNTGTAAGTNFIGTTDVQDLVIKTNSTEWMRVLSNGNIGIGTTTPNFKLHIGGGGNGSGNQTGIQVGDVGTGPGPLFLIHNQPQIQGNSYYNSGFFYAGGTGKPSVIQLSDGIRFVTSNNAPGAANTPVTDFAESMTISTNGNVGIGVPIPNFKLHISGASTGNGNHTGVQIGDVGAGPGPLFLVHNSPQIQGNAYYNGGYLYAGGAGKPSVIAVVDGIWFSTSNNPAGAANTSVSDMSVRMHITPDGKVGIGTYTPTYNLEVIGTAQATQFKLSALNTAPASAAAAGTTGEIRITNGFIYVCVAPNTWQRASLSSW